MLRVFFQEGKGGRKRERNIDLLPLTCPQLGTWPAALTGFPVPLLGIDLVTFRFTGQRSVH